ncbi:Phytanoyl-CoA dioxygenase (PhyH) [compost metagenome]|uniref:Phytanoyl-CoA dioxygenase n=1 Tax=Sphingobacterium siyangense TaxID=459529 RepID=A0A420FM62_9SPHI|nr:MULTISPECIES: phytanoyl-CoA dioxygenase family protein [Sphingobacterium]QQT30274.1 phytanoyl-CoA dioxygenase family protein [Sphingobacterium multivorum]QRY58917.1 phytanoyl-CoA dioxygenase family protein [Sphingobacterium siyangense]RKF33977.1 phytanoyl-CoA dioxygenase [Sphingobacterium siyangense]
MKNQLTEEQIAFYQENGYIVIEDFLNPEELETWRTIVFEAVEQRAGQKMPGKEAKVGEDDGINKDADYFGKVFDQLLNLWQTSEQVKELMVDQRIGEMAAKLAGVDGIRIWHDQALFKRPFANPTAWHLDTPFWSFADRNALSIWIALDDSTLENGCMYFVPQSYKQTGFENLGIGKNMGTIFEHYPELARVNPVATPLKAGSCTFHNGLTIHGAGPNMTNGFRRAMTCAYMPDGNVFNGQANILPEDYRATLAVGDLLNNDEQNPLIYHAGW